MGGDILFWILIWFMTGSWYLKKFMGIPYDINLIGGNSSTDRHPFSPGLISEPHEFLPVEKYVSS